MEATSGLSLGYMYNSYVEKRSYRGHFLTVPVNKMIFPFSPSQNNVKQRGDLEKTINRKKGELPRIHIL